MGKIVIKVIKKWEGEEYYPVYNDILTLLYGQEWYATWSRQELVEDLGMMFPYLKQYAQHRMEGEEDGLLF